MLTAAGSPFMVGALNLNMGVKISILSAFTKWNNLFWLYQMTSMDVILHIPLLGWLNPQSTFGHNLIDLCSSSRMSSLSISFQLFGTETRNPFRSALTWVNQNGHKYNLHNDDNNTSAWCCFYRRPVWDWSCLWYVIHHAASYSLLQRDVSS